MIYTDNYYSFKIRPGGSTRNSADPGRVEEKTGKEKTRRVDQARSGQKPGCNSLTFVFFFIKTTSFWFFLKKRIDSGDPVTLSKLETRNLDRISYQVGSKNYNNYYNHSFKMIVFFLWFLSVSVCGRIIYIFIITDTLSMIWIMTWRIYAAGKCMIMPQINRSINQGLGTLGWGFLKLYPLSFEILSFFFFLLYWFMVR